ncbi:methylated-DNA--[protein]-cysteine S-methyltransferase [Streptomyces sp. H27-D2]|uniref:methylated-DNA--[protein]-cysteine S-methyltransferase n=1 Tax=Streptomyces sp. H27-D2 TaxID=3046304 RepID=UPI002DB5E030|nr:methylated-DNA--[protein]-cysteine S-methyltransferase [Streptomyces sp. H27-D2]MEC4019906.1 methylated-DNA--[protein]-cysteine S-methyltransferase [Streptomyces sp. H27-D2]
MMLFTTFDSPLGELLLTGEESVTAPGGLALAALSVPDQKGAVGIQPEWRHAPAAFAEAERQLAAFFAGELRSFDLEYSAGAAKGTAFREKVWAALDDIPYGETTSYGQLAQRIGASRAAVRAIGGAVGANPLLVFRPCHRVIGADGSLTGYAGGLERKRLLLGLERERAGSRR